MPWSLAKSDTCITGTASPPNLHQGTRGKATILEILAVPAGICAPWMMRVCTTVGKQPARRNLRNALCHADPLCKCEIAPNDPTLRQIIEQTGVPTLQEVSTTHKEIKIRQFVPPS
eukprot:CAMPEP_0203940958 /NCGR_PEP_ID=MMETSP0359-20131031/77428_1 /ASSEMBLY_ACC=CAM_ASM_000338 /TAXON_ID=268821 /ORGANISM="Scrippsiella Hangoei, Strain SHTV-5" /LENGTH=115 /DNA_ID=CAMNT_0050871449 /DNA_START=200 /DNA_END=543 /DNA_ORIENTATION=-